MCDNLRVVAGRCTTAFEDGTTTRESRGDVLVVCKPDNTLLVHDVDGYQPVDWLTRPENLIVAEDRIVAADGDESLHVRIHESYGRASYPASVAGTPVGDCTDCGGELIRRSRAITCLECPTRYSFPSDATVEDERCDDCGFPRITIRRGRSFTVCVDPDCESLDDRVRDAFDGQWACPDCGESLRVLRRGGLILGCDAYPACETSFGFPAGVVDGTCECGLPTFETATGRRCLDGDCRHRA